MRDLRRALAALLTAGLALSLAACAAQAEETLTIGGSSTVQPITELVGREAGIAVDVAAEGTLDGFERFCTGESDANNASEAIPQEYLDLCAENGIEFVELPLGLDAISLVRHRDNDQLRDVSLEELQRMWEPGSTVTRWSDLREELPDEEIVLHGRGEGSGTFEFFTHHVTGEAGQIREDYRATDDLDEMAELLAEEPYGIGFMGVGNYLGADVEALAQLSTVSVDGVEPSLEAAQSGEYAPLTRPLFLYVNADRLEESDTLREFAEAYVDSAHDVMPRVFFYRLPEESYTTVRERLDARETGSLYEGDPFREESVVELLEES